MRRRHDDELLLLAAELGALEETADDRKVADTGTFSSILVWALYIKPASTKFCPSPSSIVVSVERERMAGTLKPCKVKAF